MREVTFGKEVITMELFRKIVDELSSFPFSTLRIHGVGEPIMWRYLSDALKYAREKNVRIWLFTSLVVEDSSLLEDLARNCSFIEISVNSKDPVDYKRTKGIDAFQLVVNNIKLLRKTINHAALPTKILVSRVQGEEWNYNSSFVKYWKNTGLVDDAFIRSYHDYNHLLPSRVLSLNNEFRCLVHWARFNIDCTGKAILCFNELFKKELDADLILGDVKFQEIKDIWHCEKLNTVRRAQIMQDYSLIDYADRLPCQSCTSCQPLDGKRQTSETQVKKLLYRDSYVQK
jgi:MoaA/NifB/PqqE/SkfB family radical SAM enzyme